MDLKSSCNGTPPPPPEEEETASILATGSTRTKLWFLVKEEGHRLETRFPRSLRFYVSAEIASQNGPLGALQLECSALATNVLSSCRLPSRNGRGALWSMECEELVEARRVLDRG